jgi:cytochrome c oxidase cbb3-type subunit I/II
MLLALTLPLVASRAADSTPDSRRPLTEADARAGRTPYLRECSRCHGERGDGAGPQARTLDPPPRDFTQRPFKFRTTPAGQPPTTADVLRTIEQGIPGTAMPSFASLAEEERKQIAARVLEFARLLEEPEPHPLADPGAAPPSTPETIARGRQVYADAGCASCHGVGGKGDGDSAPDLKDVAGRPIKPADFTAGVYRGGSDARELYYRIATGVDGTPMPAYGDVLSPADLWAVVDCVRSLRAMPVARRWPADGLWPW